MATNHGLILYGYWRSSASYRVRLALAFKGLDYAYKPISLIDDGGQQFHPDYVALNPQASVPTLIHQDRVLAQSLAIIEYLDETFPDHPLLPKDSWGRAQVRALALAIATDIAPLGNLRVLQALETRLGHEVDHKAPWARHWIELGFDAIEAMLAPNHHPPHKAQFCFGDAPSLADCCLLPQAYNAVRFGCDLQTWPTIRAICTNLGHNEVIESAKPENQPDAPKTNN